MYYKKAALEGVTEAANNLASMKAKGKIKGNWTPLEMYEAAAARGDDAAEYNIGMLYLDGEAVPRDDKLAVSWLKKAAEHGNLLAQCNVGVVFATGGDGVPVQTQEAIKWLKKAALAGDNTAKQGLAHIYRDGVGVPKDPKEAARWWPSSP